MATRAGMATLMTRLRAMIGDPAGTTQAWSDEQLQDALDANRSDVRYLMLTDAETRSSGGTITYLDFYSPGYTDWESSPTIQTNTYAASTPTTSDLLIGHWTYAADQSANLPLFITGNSYDMAAAAVQVLRAWAAKVALELDYEDSSLTGTWMMKRDAMEKLTALYQGQQRVGFGTLIRGDISQGRSPGEPF